MCNVVACISASWGYGALPPKILSFGFSEINSGAIGGICFADIF